MINPPLHGHNAMNMVLLVSDYHIQCLHRCPKYQCEHTQINHYIQEIKCQTFMLKFTNKQQIGHKPVCDFLTNIVPI